MPEIVNLTIIDKYDKVAEVLLPSLNLNENSEHRFITEDLIKTYKHHSSVLYSHRLDTVLTRYSTGDAGNFILLVRTTSSAQPLLPPWTWYSCYDHGGV